MGLSSSVHMLLEFLQRAFFFNDTATTEIYTLSLHDPLPISLLLRPLELGDVHHHATQLRGASSLRDHGHEVRSEEHTSELQSLTNLVCRLLLEKKKLAIRRFIAD